MRIISSRPACDVGLFGKEDLDIRLPDYYFNALIPLHSSDTAVRNGTEILIGSHRCRMDGLEACPRVMASAEPGDVLFFNGKLVHRGCPNRSELPRNMLYVVYAAKWFSQNRDPAGEVYQSLEMPTGKREIREMTARL